MRASYFTHLQADPVCKQGNLATACQHRHASRLEATACMAEFFTKDPTPRWIVQLWESPRAPEKAAVENIWANALLVEMRVTHGGKTLATLSLDRREAVEEAARINATSEMTGIKATLLG